ncbi:MAG: HAD family hydrolase [Clostridium sp.]|nr:HAD family hydrolase [Prevotella sp.]MCM1428242.1 HAD family hydrolase [Clostridium sp.]MCM1474726.1 HAD family hydrolase [Muribaculaceae bacterium]
MSKKLVVFDLDGTLLNTIADLGASCNYALTSMGFADHPLLAYNYMVGNGVRKLIERAQPDANPETVNELLRLFREHYDQHCTDHTTPYDGIPELLRDLTSRGIAVAVATNKYQSAAEKIIQHFFPDIPFRAVMGQIPNRPIKPDPSVIFSILNLCPTPKRDVMHCGDSAVDIETARRACVESIGVTWGFRPVSELRKACADHVVSKPSEILKYIDDPF